MDAEAYSKSFAMNARSLDAFGAPTTRSLRHHALNALSSSMCVRLALRAPLAFGEVTSRSLQEQGCAILLTNAPRSHSRESGNPVLRATVTHAPRRHSRASGNPPDTVSAIRGARFESVRGEVGLALQNLRAPAQAKCLGIANITDRCLRRPSTPGSG